MKTTAQQTLRRSLYGVFAACATGGVAAAGIAVPAATAAPNPCAASEIARTIGSVSTNTGSYLDSHPDTNTALTNAAQQPAPQALTSLKTYFDANPQVSKDLQTIQQPLTGLSGQCKLPITVPQALQFLQAAAQNGGLPGGSALPAGLPSLPGGTSPAAGATAPAGTGPLPGPATTTAPSLH
ncbi:MAG: hemophore [Mycobacteriaceae bacterium]|nr:hemophore [Mycobacteriaceae bacterium]MBV9638923.1 hemophore [Mycobacteriaceae bacterium]